ncbi:hypothetical protein [Streptomyces sp. NPDC050982]|uniref:hypothetical protein n=1 Tax=Streptomyces sp. NPDC050982 TaxID=3154746 RepID=UPI0033C43AA6
MRAYRGHGAPAPYPEDHDETVAHDVREQEADPRPPIANPLPSTARYDTTLLAAQPHPERDYTASCRGAVRAALTASVVNAGSSVDAE